MNDKRFPKILKGLAVCAGYVAAFLGLMAVKAALIILLCIGLLMGATRACLTEHASPHRRGEVVRYLESAYPEEDFVVSRHHKTVTKGAYPWRICGSGTAGLRICPKWCFM